MDNLLADSHCHILDPKLRDRADQIAENLTQDGLAFMVEISADPEEAKDGLEFAERHKNVYCTIGVHPNYADRFDDEFEKWAFAQMDKFICKGGKIVAFGECGLDYFHEFVDSELQRQVFKKQIVLADNLKLPLIVHCRDAVADVSKILHEHKKYLNNGLLIHCFSGSSADVAEFEGLDAYFAFGGAITFKRNLICDGAITAVRRDRILLETDCPYLSPEPHRGKINEPKNIKFVAEKVARVLDLTFQEVARMTLENTKRFFNIK